MEYIAAIRSFEFGEYNIHICPCTSAGAFAGILSCGIVGCERPSTPKKSIRAKAIATAIFLRKEFPPILDGDISGPSFANALPGSVVPLLCLPDFFLTGVDLAAPAIWGQMFAGCCPNDSCNDYTFEL